MKGWLNNKLGNWSVLAPSPWNGWALKLQVCLQKRTIHEKALIVAAIALMLVMAYDMGLFS